jgi:hypothetical protein
MVFLFVCISDSLHVLSGLIHTTIHDISVIPFFYNRSNLRLRELL